jgi:hypothetical protein
MQSFPDRKAAVEIKDENKYLPLYLLYTRGYSGSERAAGKTVGQ